MFKITTEPLGQTESRVGMQVFGVKMKVRTW